MRYHAPSLAALSLAIAMAIAAPAPAQESAGKAPTAAQQQQLDAARAQLDAAARRYAELTREYGVELGAMATRQRLLRKPVIGVLLAPDDKAGVRIAGVTPDSAAAEAGLRSGDRIVAIDGKAIAAASPEARVEIARTRIAGHDDKSKVQLRYSRDGHEQTVAVAPKAGDRLMFIGEDAQHDWQAMQADMAAAKVAAVEARAAIPAARRAAAEARVEAARAAAEATHVAAIAPEVRREIVRMGADGKFPVIAEALRWNGLNLASIDPKLGKYFGTDKGVLVLSTGPELANLQPGDVVRSVAGKPVDSPREVMDALRGRDTGSKVAVEYLRDRKPATAQLTVPEPMRFPIPPAPPAPPAPPMAPKAPHPAPPAPPPPPAAPLPPPPPPAPPVD
jgi:S1-C subfamily serine protease